jgi:hypothetical protein
MVILGSVIAAFRSCEGCRCHSLRSCEGCSFSYSSLRSCEGCSFCYRSLRSCEGCSFSYRSLRSCEGCQSLLVQFQLSQPSFMRRVQFQLSQPSFMRRVLSFSLILYLCVLVSRILLDLAKLLYFCFYDGFSNFCRGIGKLVFSRTTARAPFHARLFVLVFTTMLQSRLQRGYGRALLPGPFRLTQRVISIKEA